MTHSKECFKCKTVKQLSDFYKHPNMPDGHVNKCKECNKKDVTKNRGLRLTYYREYDKERAKNPERKKANVEITRAWRAEDKRRSKAHGEVSKAVKKGVLVRANCVRCDNENSVAHHEDYDKPLDVMWLCTPCHKQRHKELLTEKLL